MASGYSLRQASSRRIVLLIAVREGAVGGLLKAGLQEMRLAGLSDDDAANLLSAVAPELKAPTQRRILDEAQGSRSN